jgi:hypothetical protein
MRSTSTPSSRFASELRVTTARARPCSMRYARSDADSSVEVGIETAPILVIASITSHNSIMLPSITMTWSPRRTPMSVSQFATWSDRAESSP